MRIGNDREIYIKRDLFTELFIDTNRVSSGYNLKPFNARYFEVLLQDSMLVHEFQKVGDANVNLINFIVKAIIIDESRKHIFLVDEFDKHKISIPGGHMSNYRIDDFNPDYGFVKFNLIRELCEEFKAGGNSAPYSELRVPTFFKIMKMAGFRLIEEGQLMYTFTEEKGFTVYFPIYVADTYYPDNAVRLNIEEYLKLYNNDRLNRIKLVYSENNDIRLSEDRIILKNILDTHQLYR